MPSYTPALFTKHVAAIAGLALAVTGLLAVPTAAMADPGYSISGTVSDGDGPLSASVTVYTEAGDYVTDTTSSETGEYSVDGLDAGSYIVGALGIANRLTQFYDHVDTDDPMDPDIDPVVLTDADVAGIDFDQSWAGTSSLDVTVSATGGVPTGVIVTIDRYIADGDFWTFMGEIDSDAVGLSTFAHLPEGSYRVTATGFPNFEPVEQTVEVTGATTALSVELVAQTLVSISGVVSDAVGHVAGVQVSAYRWMGDYWQNWDDDVTDAAGAYSIDAPAGHDYSLFFSTADAPTDGYSVYYNSTTVEPVDDTSPGVIHLTAGGATANITLPMGTAVDGSVTQLGGAALPGATVTAFVWNELDEFWSQVKARTTNATGGFLMTLPPNRDYTFRASKPGFVSSYLGGTSGLPVALAPGNHISLGSGGTTTVPAFELAPRASDLGKVAGQSLSYCRDHALFANDDESTNTVALPFTLNFFGEAHTSLYVNNNGNVTFDSARSDYTPSDITGATGRAIIAPFFADVDTRDPGSAEVSYGSSPDGKTFCVNWADVGYYSEMSDKLNTFQMLLTSTADEPGRSAGDFDITFNYDEITWETGSASGGTNGFGGTSAAVGFSAGTGVAGTYFQFAGSLVNGALLDSGSNALVTHQQNSTHDGRYVFEVRNTGTPISFGAITGHVETEAGAPVENAYIEATRGSRTFYTQTNAAGDYALAAVQTGDYQIHVTPTGELFSGDGHVLVTQGVTAIVDTIVLRAPVPVASLPDVSLGDGAVATTDGGVPVVYYGDPIPFRLTGQCVAATSATVTVTVGPYSATANLVASPAGSGSYAGTISPLYPHHGEGVVTYQVTCPNPAQSQSHSFDIYIDPSGIVVDQYGSPVEGATVTILRSTTEGGTFAPIPDGDVIMSPSNRTNPMTTAEDGRFNWDVQPGWYQVRVAYPGSTTVTTDAMEVPPARTELVVEIDRAGAAVPSPLVPPVISGALAVGTTLAITNGTWDSDVTVDSIAWMVGGTTVGTGLTHQILSGELPTLTAVMQAHRSIVGNEAGLSGVPHTYVFPFTYYVPTKVYTKAVKPTISGTAAVGKTLTAKPGTWSPVPTSYSYIWKVAGLHVSGATGATFVPRPADVGKTVTVSITAHRDGYRPTYQTSVATAKVAKGTLTAPTPTITGTQTVGQTLTVAVGTWGPGSVATTTQWLRAGKPISGATGSTYTLAGSDYNQLISVKVTGSAFQYTTASKTSKATGKIKIGTLSATDAPTITFAAGEIRAEVAGVLSVDTGAWAPAPVAFTYQWYLSGKAIPMATKSTYVVPSTAVGKSITVKIKSVKTGYLSVAPAASTAVVVAEGDFDATPTPTITGATQVGATLTAVPGAWEPGTAGNTYLYQWYRDSVLIPGATKSTYKLLASDELARFSVTIAAKRAGFANSAVSPESAQTDVVQKALTVVTPKITGSVAVAHTLTAVPGAWTAGTAFTYEWSRTKSGTTTLVGTSSTYLVQAADKGGTLKVKVTGTLTGYRTNSATSAATKKVP